ncbi:DUF4159 domain-containing protein [Rhodocaloribacter sp.]
MGKGIRGGLWMMAAALALFGTFREAAGQDAHDVTLAAVKYGGGGDWYQAQTPLPNFIRFVRENTLIDVAPEAKVVELTSDKLFTFPFLFLSGHGNVNLSEDEAARLRRYLIGGGFLYVDDDYGIDKYIRREMKKVFPELEFVELPFGHEIYHTHFEFSNGLPKIHEHDGKPPQGFGLIYGGRLLVYYTYETNISDGWESPEVHHDPPEKRMAALRMGANILAYALMH